MSGVRDALLAFSSNIGMSFVALATQACLAWYLGPELRGSYAVALMFGTFLGAVFAVGLDAALQYYVASKKISVSESVSIALFLVSVGSVIAVITGALLLMTDLEYFKKAEVESFLIALVYIPVSMLVGFFPRFLVGLRDYFGMAVLSIFQSISQFICIFIVLAVMGLSIYGALVAMIIAGMAIVTINMTYLVKKHGLKFKRPQLLNLKMVIKYGLKHHFARISNIINFQMGAIILAFFATKEEIGYFIVATSLMGYVVQIPGAISKALLPRVAEDYEGKINLVCLSARITGIMCGLIIVVILLIKEPLVYIVFSPEFVQVIPLLSILAIGMYVRSVTKVLIPYFNGTERPEITSYAVVSGITVNITMLYFLFPVSGLQGAAISMTSGYVISALIMLYFFHSLAGVSVQKVLIPTGEDIRYLLSTTSKIVATFKKS